MTPPVQPPAIRYSGAARSSSQQREHRRGWVGLDWAGLSWSASEQQQKKESEASSSLEVTPCTRISCPSSSSLYN
ncbi:hypothetical protein GN956_G10922 [Arapaima gigas]